MKNKLMYEAPYKKHGVQPLQTTIKSELDKISLIVDDNFISLNKLFTEVEGVTIEKYIIKRKIERIKEMLVYEDLNLDQIALKMHYNTTFSLTHQFKRETGLTPSRFKQLRNNRIKVTEIN